MRKLLLVALVAAAAIAWWRWPSSEPARGGQALFYDRIWIDHLPRGETDAVQIFAALRREPLGVFQETTRWKGSFEIFIHEPRGDGEAVFTFPQRRDRERTRYSATACNARGFEFCLELRGSSRGVRRYYSKKGWEIQAATAAALPDLRRQIGL
jgi:hypothetical protein